MANSNRKRRPRKPGKPRPDFPLYPHRAGWWAKKVLGRTRYFTRWSEDPKGKAALELWLGQKDDLLAGREPRGNIEGLQLGDLCNEFMADKDQEKKSGELSPRTWLTYFGTCKILCKVLGRSRLVKVLTPDDFRKLKAKLAKTRKAVALRNEMQRVRSLFKFAFDEGKIDRPVQFGQGFKKPKPDVIRRALEAHKAEHGDRMFEAADIRLMLDASDGNEITLAQSDEETGEPETVTLRRNLGLRAMILLAANCGFGQSDLANLPTRAVNLETGWVKYGRGKTGVPRKIPLWPETSEAIRQWLHERPKAKAPSDAGLLFLTCRGARFMRLNDKGYHIDGIGQEFQKLIRRLGLKRPRIGIYSLRHGFETVAGETADQVAVDAVMGHVPSGMSAQYRERISDERLQRVVGHVRTWLFAAANTGPGQGAGTQNTESCEIANANQLGQYAISQNTQSGAAAPPAGKPSQPQPRRQHKATGGTRPLLRVVG